jgi:hypothetical protein
MITESLYGENCFIPEKLDGSLIVRTVIDGKVHFRTRGSHELFGGDEEHDSINYYQEVNSLVASKYPRLNDPTFYSETSMLFEFVSPKNRIIIKYEEPALYFLAVTSYVGNEVKVYASEQLCNFMHKETGVPIPKFFTVKKDVNEVIAQIRTLSGMEGVVLWCPKPDGSVHLSKIKAIDYLRLHSLRYHITAGAIQSLIYSYSLDSLEKCSTLLESKGFDFETIQILTMSAKNM